MFMKQYPEPDINIDKLRSLGLIKVFTACQRHTANMNRPGKRGDYIKREQERNMQCTLLAVEMIQDMNADKPVKI